VSVFSYRWFPSSLYGGTIQYFKLNTAVSIIRKNIGDSIVKEKLKKNEQLIKGRRRTLLM
jgi:hypothetical protein